MKRLCIVLSFACSASAVLVTGCDNVTDAPFSGRVPIGGDAGLATDGACVGLSEGCACGEAPPVDCYLEPTTSDDGSIMCHRGTRYCRSGAWTSCESVQDFTLGREGAALITGPSACNPCDPRCFITRTTPGSGDLPGHSTDAEYDPRTGGIRNIETRMGGGLGMIDSDRDGVPDVADGCVGPGVAARPDGSCDGRFIYRALPAGSPGVTANLPIEVTIRTADVYFLMDTTGSMGDELARLRTDLTTGSFITGCTGGILGAIQCEIPDAWFGVGYHDDYPYCSGAGACYGRASSFDIPYFNVLDITSSLAAAQTAVNSLGIHNGADGPESQTQALWAIATGGALGPYLGARTGCATAGGYGYPCFRAGAIPIIIHITDAPYHNGPPIPGPGMAYPYAFTWGTGGASVTGNDTPATAVFVPSVIGTWTLYSGTTAGGTNDATDGSCGSSGAPDSWFAFDVPAGPDQTISISIDSASYDTVLGLYRSSGGSAAATGNDLWSSATFESTPTGSRHTWTGSTAALGNDYSTSCGGSGSPDATWRFSLASTSTVTIDTAGSSFDTILGLWTLTAATGVSGNDVASYASAYNVGTVTSASSLSYSGSTAALANDHSPTCGGSGARDAGFRFRVTGSTPVTLTTEGSAFDTVLGLYQLAAGTGVTGSDTYATATNVTSTYATNVTYTGTTAGLVNDYSGTCGGGATGTDAAFVINTPAAGGTLNVDTIGSGFDTVLTLWQYTAPPAARAGATIPASAENFTTGAGAPGVAYLVNGAAALTPGYDQTLTGNTSAMADNRAPTCIAMAGGRDAAARIIVPAGGMTVTLDTTGSSFNTVIGIYNSAGTQTNCDNDTGASSWTGFLAAGTYYVVIDGNRSANNGAFRLRVTTPFNSYSQVACDDNSAGSNWSRFSGVALAGSATYYVVVDGVGVNGNYRLNFGAGSGLTQVACDDNGFGSGLSRIATTLAAGDYFVVVDGSGTANGNYRLNFGAPSLTEVTCNDDSAGGGTPSVISRSLAAGSYYVSLDGYSGASGLYNVNFGTSVALTPVTCNDDGPGVAPRSRLDTSLSPGRYYVAVDGRGAFSGAYTLAIGQTPPTAVPVTSPVTWTDTVNALSSRGIQVITIQTCGNWTNSYCLEGESHATALGNATGSLGSGGTPYVIRANADGSGLSVAVVDAVRNLANYNRMDVSARAVGDTWGFVTSITAQRYMPGTACTGISGGTVFLQCLPGTDLDFDVNLRNPGAPTGVYTFSIEIIGDGAIVLDTIAVRIIVPGPSTSYAPEARYWQDYDSTLRCTGTERPDWGTFNYTALVPAGTSLRFEFQAAETAAGLPTAAPIASFTTTATSGSRDIATLLAAAGIDLFQKYLRVTAVLLASSDLRSAPTLTSMDVSYTCVPAE